MSGSCNMQLIPEGGTMPSAPSPLPDILSMEDIYVQVPYPQNFLNRIKNQPHTLSSTSCQ